MPTYRFECSCGAAEDAYRSVAERDSEPPQHCGRAMGRVLVSTHATPDIEPYRSTVDGSLIQGRRQHRDHLKRHNKVEMGNDTTWQKPRPMRGDFDVKPALIAAVKECFARARGRR